MSVDIYHLSIFLSGISSLGCTKRSADLKIIVDVARFGLSVESHVVASPISSLSLNVDVRKILD